MELNRTDARTIDRRAPRAVAVGRRGGRRATRWWPTTCRCPSDELARDFIHARQVMNDAPRYEGEAEATYTVEELRAVEAASVAAHQDWWNVGVRHDATGELVGISELYLPGQAARGWPSRATPASPRPPRPRARRLDEGGQPPPARATSDPRSRWVQTWNAESNEPMLRINRALGFAPVQRFQSWYRPFAARYPDAAHEGELGEPG